MYENLQLIITFNGERLNDLPLRLGTRQKYSLLLLLCNISLQYLAKETKQQKEINCIE